MVPYSDSAGADNLGCRTYFLTELCGLQVEMSGRHDDFKVDSKGI